VALFGLDIARYQPAMDYARCHAEGAAFILHKATEGTSYAYASLYQQRIPAIKASGAVPGAYHFLRQADPVGQVHYFLDIIGDPTGMLIQLDWETAANGEKPNASAARAWVNEWNAQTSGHPVLIYCPKWFWAEIGSPGGLGDLGPLWASHYLSATSGALAALAALVPASWWSGYAGWSRPTVLQYTSSGQIAGVPNIDFNIFDGSLADLEALTGGGDDMAFDDTDKERLRQIWAVLGDAYALSGGKSIGELVFEIEQDQESIVKLVGAIAAPQVDVAALADQLRAHLGPDLVAALGAQLVKQ
jgi:GH25 family lysozyme M1 (1,4-beta-N-acetylmuramidase)